MCGVHPDRRRAFGQTPETMRHESVPNVSAQEGPPLLSMGPEEHQPQPLYYRHAGSLNHNVITGLTIEHQPL